MDRFLVYLYHDADTFKCAHVIETFLQTGSHYLAMADWGCLDGEHAAWMIVEASDREEARGIVPPPYRHEARVVKLNKFTLGELDTLMSHHRARSPENKG